MFEKTQKPERLPSETHHVIVDLECLQIDTPVFDLSPLTHETIKYKFQTFEDEVAEKLQYASIIITTTCLINAKTLGEAPYLYVSHSVT
jgi:hypothetical protein